MEILLKFECDNKWYFVVKEKGYIKYCFLDDGKYNFDLDKEEIDLVKQVIASLAPSDKRIKLMDYKYKGNTYEVLLDPKTNIRHFSPMPKDDILYELNMLFNNMDECVYEEAKEATKKSEKNIKRIINIGKKLIIVYATQFILLAGTEFAFHKYTYDYASHDRDGSSYQANQLAIEYTKSLSNEEIDKMINDAVMKNTNITLKDKMRMLEYLTTELFIDNKEFMDIKDVEKTLSNVKIKYVKGKYLYGNLNGSYNPLTNVITFYKVNDISEVNDDVFAHELYHALAKTYWPDSNKFLTETVNTIFTDEYGKVESENLYACYYNYTKALMEIIGSEPLKLFHSYTSVKPVINALVEITGTEDDAIKLLLNLENYAKIYGSDTDNEEKEANLKALNETIVEQMGKYYYAKYEKDMSDDFIMLYYLKPDVFEKLLNERYRTSIYEQLLVTNNKKYFVDNDGNDGLLVEAVDYSYTYEDEFGRHSKLFNIHLEGTTVQVTTMTPEGKITHNEYRYAKKGETDGLERFDTFTIDDSSRYISENNHNLRGNNHYTGNHVGGKRI